MMKRGEGPGRNPYTEAVTRSVACVHTTFEDEETFLLWIKASVADENAGALELTELIKRLGGSWIKRHLYDRDADAAVGMAAEAVLQTLRVPAGAAHASRYEFSSAIANCLVNGVIRNHNKSAKGLSLHPDFEVVYSPDGLRARPRFSERGRAYYDKLVLTNVSKRRPKNEVADPETIIQVKNVWMQAIKNVAAKSSAKATPYSRDVVLEIVRLTGRELNVVLAAMRRLARSLKGLQEGSDQLDLADLSNWLIDEEDDGRSPPNKTPAKGSVSDEPPGGDQDKKRREVPALPLPKEEKSSPKSGRKKRSHK